MVWTMRTGTGTSLRALVFQRCVSQTNQPPRGAQYRRLRPWRSRKHSARPMSVSGKSALTRPSGWTSDEAPCVTMLLASAFCLAPAAPEPRALPSRGNRASRGRSGGRRRGGRRPRAGALRCGPQKVEHLARRPHDGTRADAAALREAPRSFVPEKPATVTWDHEAQLVEVDHAPRGGAQLDVEVSEPRLAVRASLLHRSPPSPP